MVEPYSGGEGGFDFAFEGASAGTVEGGGASEEEASSEEASWEDGEDWANMTRGDRAKVSKTMRNNSELHRNRSAD